MGAGFAEDAFEALHFHGQELAAGRVEAVVAPARVIIGRRGCGLLDQALFQSFLRLS